MNAPKIPVDWPYQTASRHIQTRRHLWHIQEIGSGPLLILLHGAGGASHSFRHLMPYLSPRYRVITLDLPGQGFSILGAHGQCSLNAMAQDIADLAQEEAWVPVAIIGHSAGAAIALRLTALMPLGAVIGINAALDRFDGVAGWLFPALARFLSLVPFLPQVFSKLAGTPRQVSQLLASTGSKLDAEGAALYLRLLQKPSHVAATLSMMAQWDLTALLAALPQIKQPCLLITSEGDRAVPPAVSDRAAARLPNAQRMRIPRFGHLVHEEAPAPVAEQILAFLQNNNIAAMAPT